jgi:hydrogenase-4 component E
MRTLALDIAHVLSGGVLVLSFTLLRQRRLAAVLTVYAGQALVLALSVAWQALIRDEPLLLATAALALLLNGLVIPVALHRTTRKLGIYREAEPAQGAAATMFAGLGLAALALVLFSPAANNLGDLAQEDMAFALAVVLLGLLLMTTRRSAVTQIVGFMSMENGLVLAATGAKGTPLLVELLVGLSVLATVAVAGILALRIRERFDSLDVTVLDGNRGGRL